MRVVLDDLRERLAAVALRILDLLADLARTLADPRHLARREVPVGRPRNARLNEVAILMAARALHADHAVVVRAACDGRLVRAHLHALRRHVAVRVAVGAARMEKYPARLEEERARPVFLVRNNREVGDGAQLMTGYRWQRRNVARSAGGGRQQRHSQAETKDK